MLLATSLFSFNSAAITHGEPDGDDHPAVCAIAAFDENGSHLGFGSGTLIAPDVVLTAGHVTALAYMAKVYFGEDVINNPIYVAYGAPHSYPGLVLYDPPPAGLFSMHGDVGVVVLASPVPSTVVAPSEYGMLPSEDMVETLEKKAMLDIVGYGMQEMVKGEGKPYWDGYLTRYASTCELINTNYVLGDEFMKLSSNPSKGKGGTSFGDSGGPVYIEDTNTIVGITSFGPSYWCTSAWYAFRVDTGPVLEWIYQFIA